MELTGIIRDVILLIVPATVIYFLMKRFFDHQLRLQYESRRATHLKEVIPHRLQAYERLILLAERISPAQLALRLYAKNSTATDLKNAILVSIQKEYEHNLTQQIYVSAELWKMIVLIKDKTLEMITEAYTIEPGISIESYQKNLYTLESEWRTKLYEPVQRAIHNELDHRY